MQCRGGESVYVPWKPSEAKGGGPPCRKTMGRASGSEMSMETLLYY